MKKELEQTITSFHNSRRVDIDGVHFLQLRGSSRERAQAHATLLKEEIHQGVLPYLAEKNQWMMRRAPGALQNKTLQNIAVAFYEKVFTPLRYRYLSQEQKDIIEDLAEYSNLSFETVRGALLQTDGLMFLSKFSVMQHLAEREKLGCTSAVVLKERTLENRLLVARNMDYPVVGRWETQPTVLFHEPTEKDEIPHVAVTSAGVHTSGLTGMNAEGLTIATHAHYGKKFSFRGASILTLGSEIISKAHSLEEAISVAKKYRRSAYWAFVISSAKENDAVVIEMSPNKTHVRHAQDNLLVHSNYFQGALRKEEALLCSAVQNDLKARVCRMEEILREYGKKVPYQALLAALGDHRSPQSKWYRVYGDTLSVITTIKSVVFEPESQKLWVSSRKESPTGLGDFLEVDVEKFWKENCGEREQPSPVKKISHSRYWKKFQEAVHHYHLAYKAWHTENHHEGYRERTLEHLRDATGVKLEVQDDYLWMQRGLVAFVLGYYPEARSCFETVREVEPHIMQVRDLFLARTYDLIDFRESAKKLYAQHEHFSDPKLKKAFLQGKRSAYQERNKKSILLDLQFPDAMQY